MDRPTCASVWEKTNGIWTCEYYTKFAFDWIYWVLEESNGNYKKKLKTEFLKKSKKKSQWAILNFETWIYRKCLKKQTGFVQQKNLDCTRALSLQTELT